MKYIKKPIVIEAIQLLPTYESVIECRDFINGSWMVPKARQKEIYNKEIESILKEGKDIKLKTLESDGETQTASFGDYVIKGVKGEFYPCKPDIFLETYEIAE